ncbi:Hypothetical predicted protein [Octopus vulgaris]|uniref:Brinker DNA-binding domain-containing protein n=1 Tax=Octopus vulgaris TaxID=6645 RepID=A0AA36B3M1_OCTVU|nr:Hypothetical predicted protein [Octopus vulgaris]
MATSSRRYSYTIGYKLQVIEYAKQHGNGAAERHLGAPLTEKMIRYWKRQEDLLKPATRLKSDLHQSAAKWPEVEQERAPAPATADAAILTDFLQLRLAAAVRHTTTFRFVKLNVGLVSPH